MVDSPFHDLLLKQSITRLREMLAQADEQLSRVKFERQYIANALAAKEGGHRKGSEEPPRVSVDRHGSASSTGRQATLDRRAVIRDIMATERDVVWMPSVVREKLAERGIVATVPAVRATMKSMLDEELVRPHDGNGFKLASRNGSSAESNAGPTENETTEPLLPATGSQEGAEQ